MILVREEFEQALRNAGNFKDNPYVELDILLSKLPENEQRKRKEEYLLDVRIMKATSLKELSDITFKQVLECIESSEFFIEMFKSRKARYYFDRFERIRSVRTQRKRRVL